MKTYISNSIIEATSIEQVVEIINSASKGHSEGIEGINFTPEDLAGQYGWAAATEAGYGVTRENFDGQLELLASAGAVFDNEKAIVRALALA